MRKRKNKILHGFYFFRAPPVQAIKSAKNALYFYDYERIWKANLSSMVSNISSA